MGNRKWERVSRDWRDKASDARWRAMLAANKDGIPRNATQQSAENGPRKDEGWQREEGGSHTIETIIYKGCDVQAREAVACLARARPPCTRASARTTTPRSTSPSGSGVQASPSPSPSLIIAIFPRAELDSVIAILVTALPRPLPPPPPPPAPRGPLRST